MTRINLKKILFAGAVLSSALVLSACSHNKQSFSTNKGVTTSTNQSGSQTETSQQSTPAAEAVLEIVLSDSGITPSESTIDAGDAITYKNNSAKKVQIASDPHPTHTANSELTDGDFVMELDPGESATVTLAKVGNWGFHDHLNPGMRAKITVE